MNNPGQKKVNGQRGSFSVDLKSSSFGLGLGFAWVVQLLNVKTFIIYKQFS